MQQQLKQNELPSIRDTAKLLTQWQQPSALATHVHVPPL
jgi:hypothetical protein